MKNEQDSNLGAETPQQAFDRMLKKDSYYESFPYFLRGNPDRFFSAINAPFSDGTLVCRSFNFPFNDHFYERTRVSLVLPNIAEKTPDKFAQAEITHVKQAGEHEDIVWLEDKKIDLNHLKASPVIHYSVAHAYYGTDNILDCLRVHDLLSQGYQDLFIHGAEFPLVVESPNTTSEICISAERKGLVLTSRTDSESFQAIIPARYSLDDLIERLIREGKLDENLLYHALDNYGQWDESFNSIDWAGEVGAQVTKIDGPSGDQIRGLGNTTISAEDI